MTGSQAPVIIPCRTCETVTVSRNTWRKRPPEARAALLAAGVKPRRADQCVACFARDEARREDGPLSVVRNDRAIVLAEWRLLYDPALSTRENCRRIAPRLGMRWRSLQRAITRAGVGTDAA